MSYTALYRRLRPKNFEQVIGQQHIVKTLQNQIKTDRISHAYLFCGTRGTGKTSTAKIFAKLLNCKEPIDNKPCDKCDMCVSFNENRNLNIIEIDAASNNSVDDVREIREEVKYPPTNGRFKVYIIDEVHMLSIGAFNALLKTLEEPPSYVIFILATTDPHKIPVTILSRCQRFDFKRISTLDIYQTLKKYMETDNVHIDDDAINYIAKICDGAMRDALSILDQCISFYYGEKITLNKVLDILGAVDDDIFFKFLDSIIDFDATTIIYLIDEIVQNGKDISQFLSDLIAHTRNLLIASIPTQTNNSLDISTEKFEKLKAQSKKIDRQYLLKLIDDFSIIQNSLKYCFDERIVLEAGLLKLCYAVAEEDITDIKQKLTFLEKKLETTNTKTVYVQKQEEKPQQEEKLRELAIPEDIKTVIDNFNMVINKFDGPEKAFLSKAKPKSLEDSFLYIVSNAPVIELLKKSKKDLQDVLFELFNKQYEIKFLEEKTYNQMYKKLASSTPKKQNNIQTIEDIKNVFPKDIVTIE